MPRILSLSSLNLASLTISCRAGGKRCLQDNLVSLNDPLAVKWNVENAWILDWISYCRRAFDAKLMTDNLSTARRMRGNMLTRWTQIETLRLENGPSPNTWLNYTDDIKFNGNWLALVNNYNCFVDWNEMDLNRPQNWFRHSPAAVEAAYLMMNVRFLFSVLAPRCWRLPQRLRLDFLVLGAVIVAVAVAVVRIRLLLEKMHLMNRKDTT